MSRLHRMNYEEHYNRLIERAKNRLLEGYSERHHVVPRCIGGSDEADNLVRLTAEEHYVAHQLLVKMYPGHRGLIKAACMMAVGSNNGRSKNKQYKWLKARHSESMKGNTYSLGHKWTDDRRAAKSEAMTGFKFGPHSKEHKARIGAGNKGKIVSLETRALISKIRRSQASSVEIDGMLYNSRKEAAHILNKHVTTIAYWIRTGKATDKGIIKCHNQ